MREKNQQKKGREGGRYVHPSLTLQEESERERERERMEGEREKKKKGQKPPLSPSHSVVLGLASAAEGELDAIPEQPRQGGPEAVVGDHLAAALLHEAGLDADAGGKVHGTAHEEAASRREGVEKKIYECLAGRKGRKKKKKKLTRTRSGRYLRR